MIVPDDTVDQATTFLGYAQPSTSLFQVDRSDTGYNLYLTLLGDKPTISMRSVVVGPQCTILPVDLCPEQEEEVVFTTSWTKVRFDPNAMKIDTQDFSYAKTEVTFDSNDSGATKRRKLYEQQHVALGVAYGAGAIAYVDLTNQIVEFDLTSDVARPSMPFDDSLAEPFVWYNNSHKEAKVFNPSAKLGSLSKGRYLPVKFTNSEAHDVLSFDHQTGKAAIKLSFTVDSYPKKIQKTLPFDLVGSTIDYSSLFTQV